MRPAIPIGLRYMAAGAFFFSLMSALVKVAGRALPTMEVVLVRSAVVTALAAGTLVVRGRPMWGGERRLLVVRGVVGFLALTCFYYAVIHLPLADATVIQYTNPVFTALLAAAVLGETLRAREVALTLASLAGVVLIARPGFLFGASPEALDPVAVGVALTGAVLSAGAYVTVRRLRGEDAMVVVLYFAGISTLAAAPFTVPVWEAPDGLGWLVLAAIGVTTHLGQLCLTLGLRSERAGRAMAVGYLQIVFAAILGALFFHELPDRWGVAGALVVVASTFLIARSRTQPPAKS